MNADLFKTQVLTFDFSTAEGHELAKLLELLIAEAHGDLDLCLLADICDKLGDANYLATWKRENVSLELSMDELIALNGALLHAGGSPLADKFALTGELRCCLITSPVVDRVYSVTSGT